MHLSYPPSLPVSEWRETIIAAICEHQVLIVIGDTGSGKTTQLPKMCLEAGRGVQGMIGCTQPRRIAAVSVAERVAEELRSPSRVGCKIRFHDRTTGETLIKFMTDGVLLAETRQDRLLRQYDTLIVDEAHERSLNIDFLLGYLKNLLATRPDLKLIISSATIDTATFSCHFDQAPVIEVTGRTYPIITIYREPRPESEEDEFSPVDLAIGAIDEIALLPAGGDILVFMPTERDILETIDGLSERYGQSHLLLPLYGRLPAADQRRIFQPAKKRKIIVATNVAETSITVPGIRHVVDTGLARIPRYNVRAGTTSLQVSRISRASCDQRRGRCGRTGPGVCIRLYSEEDFLSREPYTPPEIQRSNLAEVILQMISLELGDPRQFPFIDPPSPGAIRDGYRTLRELGALAGEQQLTANGRLMAGLPLDPRLSRIIIEGAATGALKEILVLAAALSIQDPRIRPTDKEHKADEAHRQFVSKQSDFLTLLALWNAFHESEEAPTMGRLARFCKASYLSWQRMREWMDVHEQLLRLLHNRKGYRFNTEPATFAAIHIALTSGFLRNICRKKEKNTYQSGGGREVVLFPGSGLYGKGPEWVVAAEFVETTQLFARTTAAIEVEWLERLGGSLCKRSWADPHWEKKSGRVLATERVSLFGLPIVAGRKVDYSKVNDHSRREAREIFIRSALIGNELGGRYPFLAHNTALLATLEEMEERSRRRDLVVDEEALFAFYDNRLQEVHDRFSLDRLLRQHRGDSFLCMTEADILLTEPDSDLLYRFPTMLRLGDLDLELSYVFQPGDEADGVSVRLPRHLLSHINPQHFEWLVPGLLPEKLLLLCRRLPKRQRRSLVPLPDAVDRLLDELTLYKGSLYQELEKALLRCFQVVVGHADWQVDALPPHLRMRFVVVDEQGKVLCTGRSFTALLQQANAFTADGAARERKPLPPPRAITAADLDTIERRLPVLGTDNRVLGFVFPSIVIDGLGQTALLHYVEDEVLSRRHNRLGMQVLYGLEFPVELAAIRKLGKAAIASHSASWLALGAKLPAAELRDALLAFLLDAVFQTGDGEIPSSHRFIEVSRQAREGGLTRTAGHLLARVVDVLQRRREVLRCINEWASRARSSRAFCSRRQADYLDCLEHLVPSDFLLRCSPEQLTHLPRYLQALTLRIQRAEHAPQKDSKKAERLERELNRLEQLAQITGATPPCRTAQEEYRFLVEEFRVSVFAPELGTARSVSEQRLAQKWQEVENLCRRVE